MNLTYQVENNKYTILKDNRPWIVQDDYFPYPGATVEESAQNHINQIIADNTRQEEDIVTREELEAQSTELKLAIAETAETEAMERANMQLAIAELAEFIAGGA
ncbi:hypothetical protein MKZ02_19890 [Pseudobacillus sp. FSL P4-0506]|uniref:hypothetical protein n=1 Tax=Pseudobacillus sp. FSL P4-0506 TaxID=2921576 RepID=UPI0030F7D187